jgi:hypothetical protein
VGSGLFDDGPAVFELRSISLVGSLLLSAVSILASKNSFLNRTLSAERGVECDGGMTAGSVSTMGTEFEVLWTGDELRNFNLG